MSREKWKLLELSMIQTGDLICRWIPPSDTRSEILDRMNEVSRMVQAELERIELERTDAKAGERT